MKEFITVVAVRIVAKIDGAIPGEADVEVCCGGCCANPQISRAGEHEIRIRAQNTAGVEDHFAVVAGGNARGHARGGEAVIPGLVAIIDRADIARDIKLQLLRTSGDVCICRAGRVRVNDKAPAEQGHEVTCRYVDTILITHEYAQ